MPRTLRHRPVHAVAAARLAAILVIAAAACGASGLVAAAEEYRIETKIYDQQGKLATTNVTLFTGDRVFDFLLTAPQEITVFDPTRGNFTLLNQRRRVQTTLDAKFITRIADRHRSWASRSGSRLLKFAARPAFSEVHDARRGTLELVSQVMSYKVRGEESRDPDLLGAYRRFADWFARLNSTRGGTLPPNARLALNEALGKYRLLPHEVTLTLVGEGDRPGLTMRSTHKIERRLGEADRALVEQARASLSRFRKVDFAAYRGFEQGDE